MTTPQTVHQKIEEELSGFEFYYSNNWGTTEMRAYCSMSKEDVKQAMLRIAEATWDEMEAEDLCKRYPTDVFLPLPKELLDDVHGFMKTWGRSIDALSGYYGRFFGKQIVEHQQKKRDAWFKK